TKPTLSLQLFSLRELGSLDAQLSAAASRSAAAVSGLAKLVATHALPCQFQPRQTLFLAQNHESARDLYEERQLRRRAGLPGVYLEHCD
ncbi:hypothetical protein SB766_27140, partial [Pseudomonas sp. SIMBA_077]